MVRRRFRFRLRSSRRLVVLVALAMLLQQLVMSAYACTLPIGSVMPDTQMAAMADGEGCAQMQQASGLDRALCVKHCAPDTPSNPDIRSPSVPFSMLPALAPAMPALLPMSLLPPRPDRVYLAQASPPPPILFCSLLI